MPVNVVPTAFPMERTREVATSVNSALLLSWNAGMQAGIGMS